MIALAVFSSVLAGLLFVAGGVLYFLACRREPVESIPYRNAAHLFLFVAYLCSQFAGILWRLRCN